MFRSMTAVACLIVLSASAFGAPRFAEFLENPTPKVGVFVAAATQPVPESAPDSPPRGEVLLNAAIQKIVTILSRPLDANATTIQRSEHNEKRNLDLTSLVCHVPGNAVQLSFRIVDICPRPAPKPPHKLSSRPTAEQAEAFNLAQREYDAAMAEIEQRPLVAIGELNLTNQDPRTKDVSAETRKKIAELNADITALRRKLVSSKNENERKYLRSLIEAKERDRNHFAGQQKSTAPPSEAGSDDYVYIFGTEEKFGKWRKQQRRSVIGWIDRVRFSTAGETRSKADVKLDAVLQLLEDDSEGDEPTTQPGE